jgi:hypothetical protein
MLGLGSFRGAFFGVFIGAFLGSVFVFVLIFGLELSSELFHLLRQVFLFEASQLKQRWSVDYLCSVEAKAFYSSVKADASEIRLEKRRKGFFGFIFLGLQCFVWLLATVEEALKEPVKKDFVMSYREDVKALMVRRGGNKAGCYLEVAVFTEGGRKGVIWFPEGREGWG